VSARKPREEIVAELPIDPQEFTVYGKRIFGVLPNADPVQVRAGADMLLALALEMNLASSGSIDLSKEQAAAAGQFLIEAAQAAYRSIVGMA